MRSMFLKLQGPKEAYICTLFLKFHLNWTQIVDFRAKKSKGGLKVPAPYIQVQAVQ